MEMTPKPAMKKLLFDKERLWVLIAKAYCGLIDKDFLEGDTIENYIQSEIKRNVREFAKKVRPAKEYISSALAREIYEIIWEEQNETIDKLLKEYE